jgi:UDP-glucose 4-epimerase
MTILVTGGAGFIGSHTCLVLLEAGYNLVVLDNFSNSSPEALRRVAELAGLETAEQQARLQLVEGDIRNPADLDRAFAAGTPADGPITGVIHFAGLKAVGKSVQKPLLYWDVNLNGSPLLVEAMCRHGCRTLVFSSTATVYGEPEQFPITEAFPTNPLHPYAQTKLAVEWLLAAQTRRAFPTSCCPSSPRWPAASGRRCASLAATGPRPMAPACVTISM